MLTLNIWYVSTTNAARGWQVRLPHLHPLSIPLTREYTEFFSDNKNGGERGAYEAAKARRDKLMTGIAVPVGQRALANTRHMRSSSGVVGITLAFRAGRSGESAFSWKVVWRDKARTTHRRTFSVAAYGFAEALEKAVQLREKKTGLKFSDEQLLEALELHRHVVRYCKTGKIPILKPLLSQVRASRANNVER
jgi:hypothetical protein